MKLDEMEKRALLDRTGRYIESHEIKQLIALCRLQHEALITPDFSTCVTKSLEARKQFRFFEKGEVK